MSTHEHVAIFWDYENCTPSSTMTGYDIVNNIREIAHQFGSVKLFKAYLELSERSPKSISLRSELQACGVSLTDCPHNGRKEVADKMILVDMLTYALDNAAPATIVLISGDRDFVYAVSVLRLRRYRVVLVAPNATTHQSLRLQATTVLDWDVDVLCRDRLGVSSLPTPGDCSRSTHKRAQSSTGNTVAQGSPLPRSQRRLSFREPPVRPSIELLQPAATIEGPRAPLKTPQHALAPAEDDVPLTDAVPSRSLPTPASEPSSSRLAARSTVEGPDSVEDIADLNLHLRNLGSQTPSSDDKSPSPFIAVEEKGSGPAAEQDDNPADNPQRRTLSPAEVRGLFRGDSAFPLSHANSSSGTSQAPTPAEPQMLSVPMSTGIQPEDLAPEPAVVTCVPANSVAAEKAGPSLIAPAPTSALPPSARSATTATFLTASSSPSPALSHPRDYGPPDLQSVPRYFHPLLFHLESCRLGGEPRQARSSVAIYIKDLHPDTYRLAGVKAWREYAAEAERLGLIELGGLQGGAWVELRPDWFGCLM